MKKILFGICFSILFMMGCSDGGKKVVYKLEKGDLMLTITRNYIIIDTLYGINDLGDSMWRFDRTISRSDSVACNEFLERLQKR